MISFSIEQLYIVHSRCSHHREHILSSERCGCFHCLRWFSPANIEEWIDEPGIDDGERVGQTALCPHCGIDAVLPEIIPGMRLCSSLLLAMRKHFFDE
ncbi:MAG: hypothetical protein DDT37_01786 [Firmicutes bacterium]|nr:hypothetical protein [candidate division NPL-UPA2 bacterium]